MTSVKWNGQEVERQPARAVVATLAFLAALLAFVLVLLVVVPLCILSVPLHVLLRACGRRGFVESTSPGSFSYKPSMDGFRKAL